ncbi:MAG: DUF3987 domain-containing protein, partial [Isosphaeraceae bacterium]
DSDSPLRFRFDPEAQQLFVEWLADLESKLRGSELHAALVSHLSKYRSLMPSLAQLFYLVEVADGAGVGLVSLRSARLAVAWCDLLEAHARRVYDCVAAPDLESAVALSERIKAGALPSPFQHRDVYRKGWSSLDSPEAVRRAAAVLEDFGWLHFVEIQETGGAPRLDIHIHPKLPRKAPGISETPTT